MHYTALSAIEKEDCLVVNLLVEHVAGTNLNQSLITHGPVPLDKLCHYMAQLLAALDYLHSNSVVHKQLGASSVLVDSEGNVRLTDYSLSKRFADICKEDIFEQPHVRFTEDTVMPTKPGKKGDVWNLGLMLLALSQGKEVKEYPVTIPSSLPADFQDFLHKYVYLTSSFQPIYYKSGLPTLFWLVILKRLIKNAKHTFIYIIRVYFIFRICIVYLA